MWYSANLVRIPASDVHPHDPIERACAWLVWEYEASQGGLEVEAHVHSPKVAQLRLRAAGGSDEDWEPQAGAAGLVDREGHERNGVDAYTRGIVSRSKNWHSPSAWMQSMELQVSKNTFDMEVVRSLAATGWVPLVLDWTVGCVGTPLESVMGASEKVLHGQLLVRDRDQGTETSFTPVRVD